jgi:hypothetical protein
MCRRSLNILCVIVLPVVVLITLADTAYSQAVITAKARIIGVERYNQHGSGSGPTIVGPNIIRHVQSDLADLPSNGSSFQFNKTDQSSDLSVRDTCDLHTTLEFDSVSQAGKIGIHSCSCVTVCSFYTKQSMYPGVIHNTFEFRTTRIGVELESEHDPNLTVRERNLVSASPSLAIWSAERLLPHIATSEDAMKSLLEKLLTFSIPGIYVQQVDINVERETAALHDQRIRIHAKASNESTLLPAIHEIDGTIVVDGGNVTMIQVQVATSPGKEQGKGRHGIALDVSGVLTLEVNRVH